MSILNQIKYKTFDDNEILLSKKLEEKECLLNFFTTQGYKNENSSNNILSDEEYTNIIDSIMKNNFKEAPDIIVIED